MTQPCADAMDAIAAVARGRAPDVGPGVRAHLAGCPRCRGAYAHAAACAPWLAAGIVDDAGGAAHREASSAWERRLFLRLLAEERASGTPGPRPDARGRRAVGPARHGPARGDSGPRPRSPAWARLAAWLGGWETGPEEGEWRRWRRRPEADASPR